MIAIFGPTNFSAAIRPHSAAWIEHPPQMKKRWFEEKKMPKNATKRASRDIGHDYGDV